MVDIQKKLQSSLPHSTTAPELALPNQGPRSIHRAEPPSLYDLTFLQHRALFTTLALWLLDVTPLC